MNRGDHHPLWKGLIATAFLSGADMAVAQPLPGWYGGVGGFSSSIDDTEYRSFLPPTFTPGEPGTPGDPGTCLPPIPPLLPEICFGGTPGSPGTPGTFEPGNPYSLRLETKRGTGGYFQIGYGFENGLRPEFELSFRKNDLEAIRFGEGFNDGMTDLRGQRVPDSRGSFESLGFVANLWFDLRNSSRVTPYFGGGLGLRRVSLDVNVPDEFSTLIASDSDSVTTYQLGAGVGVNLTDRFSLSLDARYFESDRLSFQTRDQRAASAEYKGSNIGLAFRYVIMPSGFADEDGDGVPDRLDRCPGTPPGVRVDRFGCPLDSDGDGIPDHLDQCPNTPPGVQVDARGCPLDSDGDGVPDYLDQCPGTAPGVAVGPDGCPVAVIDSDGDGIPDNLDRCPDTPPGVPVDRFGCPLDSDGDGVPDYLDECPNTPAGLAVLPNGCALVGDCRRPRPGEAVDERGCAVDTSFILRGVKFEFDSARLTREAQMILDKVAVTLAAYPDINVELEGHTDNIGSAAYNLGLSERRAIAVKEYLVSKGIRADRMTPVGYGLSQPIADNSTEEGREENRRVELTVRQ